MKPPSKLSGIHPSLDNSPQILNVSSYEQGNLCCKGHRSAIMHDCTKKHDQSLRSSSPGYQSLLSEWLCVVSYLNMHIPPSKLHLSLVCDVEDFKTAKAIMKRLLDWRLPTVASCNICLGQDCNFALYNLACKAAAQATYATIYGRSILSKAIPLFGFATRTSISNP